MKTIYDIVIIGSGASGMMAAVASAAQGAGVLLLEHKEKAAGKLLATGNGKCNFTNAAMDASHYYGDRRLFEEVYSTFPLEHTLAFFREIGVYPKCRGGWYYPASEQAASVAQALECELSRLKADRRFEAEVTRIRTQKDGCFVLELKNEVLLARRIIFCCGSKASPKSGSDGSAFSLIRGLGHHMTDMQPALCGFHARGLPFKKTAGVRLEADLTLFCNEKEVKRERGELQLTEYGISGIPVFQISSPASRSLAAGGNVIVRIDFLPGLGSQELLQELTARSRHFARETAAWLLNGILPSRLIPALLSGAGIPFEKKIGKITAEELLQLIDFLKGVPVTLLSPRGFENAQVCTGGLVSSEINAATLESRLVKGIYFAGEILDVDGECGGYNLQWAWSSGHLAGCSAAASLHTNR